MYVFKDTFHGISRKNGGSFNRVTLFEQKKTVDGKEYFKEVTLFVEQEVYDSIIELGFKFGDIVRVKKGKPVYFGGPEQLKGLELLVESSFFS